MPSRLFVGLLQLLIVYEYVLICNHLSGSCYIKKLVEKVFYILILETVWRAGLVQAVESCRLWPEGPGFESRSPRIAQARVRLATDTLPQTPHRAGALCTGYALFILETVSSLLLYCSRRRQSNVEPNKVRSLCSSSTDTSRISFLYTEGFAYSTRLNLLMLMLWILGSCQILCLLLTICSQTDWTIEE